MFIFPGTCWNKACLHFTDELIMWKSYIEDTNGRQQYLSCLLFIICTYICIFFFLQCRENSYCYNRFFVSVRKCSGVAHGKQRDRVRMCCSGEQYSSSCTDMYVFRKKKFLLICFVFSFWVVDVLKAYLVVFIFYIHTHHDHTVWLGYACG